MWYGDKTDYPVFSFSIRLGILLYCIVAFFALIFIRLAYLQLVSGDYYRERSDGNRIIIFPQPATRGKIFDRNLDVIVDNKPSFTVLFSRQTLTDAEVISTLKKVAGIIDVSSAALIKKFSKISNQDFTLVKIADNITRNKALLLSENIPLLPGIIVSVEPERVYNWRNTASHITGYVQTASYEDIAELPYVKSGNNIGKTGVERQYDILLRGKDGGMLVEVDVRGSQKKILDIIDPADGASLVLTIDKNVQESMSRALTGYKGCAVALDPSDCSVLGLVSSPDYDPNVFVSGMTGRQMSYLFSSGGKPLLNRALQCHYPPGSIFKMVTAIAGLESDIIDSKTVFKCSGFIELGKYKQKFRCWNSGGHGNMRFREALAYSCDVYFYELALLLGPTKLIGWSKDFMFGEKTGIDLPFEIGGFVPDKTWKKSRFKQSWYDGDTVNMSIGQGYMLVTPIQVAQYAACIASNGILTTPHILKKVVDENGKVISEDSAKVKKRLNIKEENIRLVKRGMLDAVYHGTAKSASVPGIDIAGKTGTAQTPGGNDHAWFVCFAPYKNPKIAIAVIVEHGGGGGEIAAPIAGKILSDIKDAGFFR